ncbi:MAG: hypothetical protein FVQ80_10350 [Planctomycetes bacterium]|nr:hypothetical protein [Planctomycetota bacterium]
MDKESLNHGGTTRSELFSFIAAIFISVCFCVAFFISSFSKGGISTSSLDGHINPNVATVFSMMRLGGVGFGKASAIVSYREQWAAENGGRAFESCDDLRRVKGIGPKTAEQMCERLVFE